MSQEPKKKRVAYGARFSCATCQKTYIRCKCKVYVPSRSPDKAKDGGKP
jgi:hypothetical protein